MSPWGLGLGGGGVRGGVNTGVGGMMSVLAATMPKALSFTTFLSLYTTYCGRLFDVTHCLKRSCLMRASPNHWYVQPLATLYNILQKDVVNFWHQTHCQKRWRDDMELAKMMIVIVIMMIVMTSTKMMTAARGLVELTIVSGRRYNPAFSEHRTKASDSYTVKSAALMRPHPSHTLETPCLLSTSVTWRIRLGKLGAFL